MNVLFIRESNTVLRPYLHRPTSVTEVAAPQKQRLLRLEQYNRRSYSPGCYRAEGSHDSRKESVVGVVGATGTGKSKLSIELATRFFGEVVNSDKIQIYRGLDISTNKITIAERCGVPHHLLGELDPTAGELPPAAFRKMVAHAIAEIASRRRIPILAGGSNSFIHAALAGRYDPRRSPFRAGWRRREWREGTLRYRCCLLWVVVEQAVLAEHLDRRVEEMLAAGMVEELGPYIAAEVKHPGLGKAIGIAEFREYFRGKNRGAAAAYSAAVAAIKSNTRSLAEEQVRKIDRLEEMGWPLRRLNATSAVKARLAGASAEAEAAWERDVAGPSAAAVEQFLEGEGEGEIDGKNQHHLIYTRAF